MVNVCFARAGGRLAQSVGLICVYALRVVCRIRLVVCAMLCCRSTCSSSPPSSPRSYERTRNAPPRRSRPAAPRIGLSLDPTTPSLQMLRSACRGKALAKRRAGRGTSEPTRRLQRYSYSMRHRMCAQRQHVQLVSCRRCPWRSFGDACVGVGRPSSVAGKNGRGQEAPIPSSQRSLLLVSSSPRLLFSLLLVSSLNIPRFPPFSSSRAEASSPQQPGSAKSW